MDLVRKSEESGSEPERTLKRLKNDEDTDLAEFLAWCSASGIVIDTEKVKITSKETSHNYGMVAIKNLEPGEILVRISKTAVLEPNTSKVKELIKQSNVLYQFIISNREKVLFIKNFFQI